MKSNWLLLIGIVFFISCQNAADKKNTETPDTSATTVQNEPVKSNFENNPDWEKTKDSVMFIDTTYCNEYTNKKTGQKIYEALE